MRINDFLCVFALTATVSAFCVPCAMAQETYESTTTWPYIYQDFVDGDIYMSGRQKVVQKMNVHLGHSRLHFLDRDIIKELMLKDVVAVVIGEDKYVPIDGNVFKVVSSCDKGMLLEQSLGDFSALDETGGAYGSSSVSSATMKLSSLDAASVLGQNHMLLLQNKHDGRPLPLITKYYIHTPGFTCPATRKELERQFSDRGDEWKTWLKSHKIRWNNPSSLSRILEFL